MEPKISIILPIYNTGGILKKTIESIINQSFTNFELLIIDDGSMDSTYEIAKSYELIDKRIRLIKKKNGGVCSARNVGLENAKGEYITFCDHDDLYDTQILEKEIELIYSINQCDIAIVGAKHIYEDGKVKYFGENLTCNSKSEISKNAIAILKKQVFGTIWNILYKRDLLNNLRFDETITKGHEDIIFNLEVLKNASSLVAIKEPYYFHFIRKNMSTSAQTHEESIVALIKANNKIASYVRSYLCDYDRFEYITLQGEYIRTVATYCVKLGKAYHEFSDLLGALDFINQEVGLFNVIINIKNKDFLSYYCLKMKLFRIYYYMLQIYYAKKGI